MPNEQPTRSVRAQFFSQLKEVTGCAETTVALPAGATIADLLQRLYQQWPALEKWNRQILVGAGVEFVARDYVIQPNDAIAIMPPVQGG